METWLIGCVEIGAECMANLTVLKNT